MIALVTVDRHEKWFGSTVPFNNLNPALVGISNAGHCTADLQALSSSPSTAKQLVRNVRHKRTRCLFLNILTCCGALASRTGQDQDRQRHKSP